VVADQQLESSAWPAGLDPTSAVISGALGKSYRSIWISDLHLGTRACKADTLLDFLRCHESENLYLVGDIVDGWSLGPSWYWSAAQTEVVKEISLHHRRGARVVFIPGNHDELHLELVETLFGQIPIVPELVHRTAEGCRMLVIHGHQFDTSMSSARWLSAIGSQAYAIALRIDQWHKNECSKFGQRSFTSYLKRPVTKAVQYFTGTEVDEREVFERARRHNADGVICGHTHRVGQHLIGPLWYINDGDWVQSCTALLEDYSGALRLLRWSGMPSRLPEAPYLSCEEA
jgi:UDP-2,3-diacylglucosamine pyrophosphatase LpxH